MIHFRKEVCHGTLYFTGYSGAGDTLVSSRVSRRAAARRFGVSESFAINLVQHEALTGSPAPVRQGRPPGRGKLAPFEGYLIAEVEAEPDITMPELAERLMARHGIGAAPAVLSRLLCWHGYTYKKP